MQAWVIMRTGDGHLLPPAMDDDSTGVFLAWPTRKEAERGFKHQNDVYKIGPDGWEIVELSTVQR